MVRFFYALSAVFLMVVALTSCEDVTTFDYLTSPDQMYVLEIERHPGAAMVSSTMWVRIKKQGDSSTGTFDTIFKGRAGNYEKVYWKSSNVIIINYCRGHINKIKTPYYDKDQNLLIHAQVINVTGITLNGQKMCPELADRP